MDGDGFAKCSHSHVVLLKYNRSHCFPYVLHIEPFSQAIGAGREFASPRNLILLFAGEGRDRTRGQCKSLEQGAACYLDGSLVTGNAQGATGVIWVLASVPPLVGNCKCFI